MKRQGWVVVVVLAAGAAVALEAGDSLWVRARNTRVRQGATPDAKVLAVLQPGQTVDYVGRDEKHPGWLKVKADGVEGVVYRSALGERPPQREVIGGEAGTAVDAAAFASSAAATRAFSPAVAAYAEEKVYRTAYDQLLVLESLARSVQDADVEAHAAKMGLAAGVAR